MKSLFEREAYEEVLQRLDKVKTDTDRLWGKMSPAQMVWHCQYPLRLAIENKKGRVKNNPLIRLFFKKSLYNDKLWRKNLPTAPQLKAKEEKDFEIEMPKLKELIKAFYGVRDRKEWNPHPFFCSFTPGQWGQIQYKHLDHHLRQFGA